MQKLQSHPYLPEWLTLIGFAVLLAVVGAFHEPWFDEAQAWQIAKCASLREILLDIPHYEGHPPLWHLILCLPAKLGVPYEWGLKSVGWLFSVGGTAFFLFRAPFARPVKCALPFTYFCFYQYSVIVRPYVVTMLALWLAADTFRDKDRRPARFVLCLLLLCLTSAYGMLVAGGIAAVWLWDILRERRDSGKPSSLVRDRRLYALVGLLAAALLLAAEMAPAADTFAVMRATPQSAAELPSRLMASFFAFLPETCLTSTPWFSYTGSLSADQLTFSAMLCCVLLTALLLAVLWALSARRHFRYFAVPYVFLALFSSFVYLSPHHVGILWLLLLFWLWTNRQADTPHFGGRQIARRLSLSPTNRATLRRLCRGVLVLALIIPTIWSVVSSAMDIGLSYNYARDTAAFLKAHHLEQRRIMVEWDTAKEDVDTTENGHNSFYLNSTELLPYFEHNLAFNYNGGDDRTAYFVHRIATDEINRQNYAAWREAGEPDVVIGEAALGAVYGADTMLYRDYAPVYEQSYHRIWKGSAENDQITVFLRRSLLEEFGLQEISASQ